MRGLLFHFSQALLQACQEYSWPGNLRELSNFIKRYLVLGDEKLAVQELHPKTDGSGPRADLAPATATRLPAD